MNGSMRTAFLLLLLGAVAPVLAQEHRHGGDPQPRESAAGSEEREVLYWYDPMHPEHRFDAPGPSPFMDMDLLPRYADEAPDVVSLAPGLAQRMNIRTAVVEYARLTRIVSTVGAIDVDQTRVMHLHARVAGWIESVHVHAVGDPVAKGQLLFTLYAPELVNAEEELLHAAGRGEPGLLAAAREKLRALGVQSEVIGEVERTRNLLREVPWRARHAGVVSLLGMREGMFVGAGEILLETVDLASLWLTAEVFPADAAKLAIGQGAEVRLPQWPGRTIDARIAYIYPTLDPVTRTVRVRVPLDNSDGTLQPGAWASVRLLGKAGDPVLSIPREALIRTGTEHRVVTREDGDRFRVHRVEPGMESDGRVEIRAGLEAGMNVVVSGQFLLDSEASFRAGFERLEAAEMGSEEVHPETVAGTGDVRSIDAGQGRIRLRHDPIPELGWPAMVMGFRIEGELPAGLKPGDAVHFEMLREPDAQGDYVIRALHKPTQSRVHDHD
ncbi:MAG: efflux RND transporter periplasmic adaptor subunit [Gammaproteobacteria bacterium]|nr:efflux RND transporter periplasmic adaptor subunit [Gammaproteobacteria bacterium]